MAEIDQIGVVNGIPTSGTGEVPTLSVIRDKLDEILLSTDDLAPASGAAAVTPSDATVLENVRALYIGTGGTVVATIGGADVTFVNVPDGTTLPVKATKVKLASTADDILALS